MEIELLDEPTTALTVQDRAALALNSTKTEQDLRALAVKNVAIVAVIDKAGRDQAHGAAMELKRVRTHIEKLSKEAREDATKFSKAVIAETTRLVAIVEPEEIRITALRDAWDEEQARIKAEKEAAERARVMAINQNIANIRSYVNLALECRTAARIDEVLRKLSQVSLDGFAEFVDEAAAVHAEAVKRVEAILVEKNNQEQEQERIKAQQQAESEKLAAERAVIAAAKAELQSAADIVAQAVAKQQAEAKAQADALAKERAVFEAEKAAARAKEQAVVQAEQFERDRKAMEDALNSAPVSVPAAVEFPIFKSTPAQPTAQELVDAVCDRFAVPSSVAALWLYNCAEEIQALSPF